MKQVISPFKTDRDERLFFALDVDGDGFVPEEDIRQALADVGLGPEDHRLAKLYQHLETYTGKMLKFQDFNQMLGSAGLLVERALTGRLAIPDFMDFADRVNSIFREVKNNIEGEQAKYIVYSTTPDPLIPVN